MPGFARWNPPANLAMRPEIDATVMKPISISTGFSPCRLARHRDRFVRFTQHISGALEKTRARPGELEVRVAASFDQLCAEP